MNAISNSSNRHIVDQLADVRAAIKELQAREDELRTLVSVEMGDGDSLGGSEFIARQVLTKRAGSIDTKAAEAAGIDLSAYRKPDTIVYSIRCERRVSEVA